jgi:hypothetical protein
MRRAGLNCLLAVAAAMRSWKEKRRVGWAGWARTGLWLTGFLGALFHFSNMGFCKFNSNYIK